MNIQQKYMGASESLIVDLNQDGLPEVVFTTYGWPANNIPVQQLYILNGQTGAKIARVDMNSATTNPVNSSNPNGAGASGAPTVEDINGDGQLEIVAHTFDGRLVVFTVPGSSGNCMLWHTGRGGYLRKGQNDIGTY